MKVLALWFLYGLSFYSMQLYIVMIADSSDDDCSFDYSFIFKTYSSEVV